MSWETTHAYNPKHWHQSVKPESLKKAIKDRMLTARPPDGDDTNTEKWRLRANKITKYKYKLIRENARYADKQRARQTNMNEAISKQICRDYQNGRCRRGQHCPRIHQDGTANTQNTNTNTQQQTNNSNMSNTNTRPQSNQQEERADCWFWISGQTCTRGDKCFFKHDPTKKGTNPQIWDTLPPKPDNKNTTNGTNNNSSANTTNQNTSNSTNKSHGGGSQTAKSHGGGTNQNNTSTSSETCIVCGKNHVFFKACPIKEKVHKALQQAGINYAHTARW